MSAWAIGSSLYGLAWLITARLVAGHIAYGARDLPDGEDWSWGWAGGILLGVIWPFALFFWTASRVPLLAIGEERRLRQKRKREAAEALRREFERTERELGLRP